MKTYAVDAGDHWEIHGNKMWISNAHVGDAGLLYAYTDRDAGHKGISAFIIEPKNLEGCTAKSIDTKLGLHCSPTGEFVFDGAKVPKDALLGEEGEGFKICMWQLNNTRINCAAGALGVAGGALDLSINYANERTQFGKPISKQRSSWYTALPGSRIRIGRTSMRPRSRNLRLPRPPSMPRMSV
jgi:glutaryl-CoA dehydrogenase (non-decarboxylating)